LSPSRPPVLPSFFLPPVALPSLCASPCELATDWFSGRGGYATSGLIYTRDPFVFYLGYGFANTGRRDDLVTFEVGFTLR